MNIELIKTLAASGATQREIGLALGVPVENLRYHINKHDIQCAQGWSTPSYTLLPIQEFKKAVAESNGIADCIRSFGLIAGSAATYRRFKRYCTEVGVIPPTYVPKKGSRHVRRPDCEVFCVNSTACRSTVRSRVLSDNLLPYMCSIESCPSRLLPLWNEQPLPLELDHENGIPDDHRLSNLRFLCPNCHAQTVNYAGKNTKNTSKPNKQKTKTSTEKIVWPSVQVLQIMVAETSYRAAGRALGVSDNAVRKRIKSKEMPPNLNG
jgi:hypothetical protein